MTVYLDIAKAFDTIILDFLLQKLDHIGFDEKFLKFFASYLVKQQKRVKTADSYSTFSEVSSRVHRGSISL